MTIVWDDDVTQLDAAHMNQLEQITRKGVPDGYASLGADGLVPPTQLPAIPPLVITDADVPASITRDTELAAGLATKADSAAVAAADVLKVDKDSVVVAATRLVETKLLAGDAQPAFRILGDGRQRWGPGGATAPDATLYRESAGRLRTDGFFRAQDTIIGGVGPTGGTGIRFLDTDIYRGGAGLLQTDTSFVVGGDMVVNNQGGSKLYFGSPVALDTNLYRLSAGILKTDGHLDTMGSVRMAQDNVSKLWLGSAFDTNLYRSAGGQLKTDGYLFATRSVYGWQGQAPQVVIGSSDGTVGGNASIAFGSANDTNLYRYTAGTVKTDGLLAAAGVVQSGHGGAAYAILDGPNSRLTLSGDTNLYRLTAGYLATDGGLAAKDLFAWYGLAQQVYLGSIGGNAGAYFGNANDASLYRAAANTLETPGTLNVGALGVNVPGVGGRAVVFGAPDSGGAGFRSMRVAN